MKKTLLFLLLTLQLASCQNHNNNKNMNEQEYEWGVAVNTPIRFYAAMVGGIPITGEVYTETESLIGEMP